MNLSLILKIMDLLMNNICRVLTIISALTLMGCSDNSKSINYQQEPNPKVVQNTSDASIDSEVLTGVQVAPGLDQKTLIAPLKDAYNRINPIEDGWESEAFSESATKILKSMAKKMVNPEKIKTDTFNVFFDNKTEPKLEINPKIISEVFRDEDFLIRSGDVDSCDIIQNPNLSFKAFLSTFSSSTNLQTGIKLYKVSINGDKVTSDVKLQVSGLSTNGVKQINCDLICQWTPQIKSPLLKSIKLKKYEESTRLSEKGLTLFSDFTDSVMSGNDSYNQQILRSTDYWRSRIPSNLGLDVVANHGLAIGDVNGDGLEDIYICQQGGLPNLLYIQNENGTLMDHTSSSGADWLEYCSSALIIDIDNDGDRDLVIGQDFKLLFMENDGTGSFVLSFGTSSHAQTFSLSASDFDLDGLIDIYACGYNPSANRSRSGALGEPIPYHDAQNGGRNMLLRNKGNWDFEDVTAKVGLDHNNNRFSFASAWEDFDNDGDLDLYVANDYGRNNLYRNSSGEFADVAGEMGVEDMSAGMSASWGDFNRDGYMDLYVSNMFSAAGNRITFQRQFKPSATSQMKAQYQRHARGNTLFQGTKEGEFQDVSIEQEVTMGRWAWGSRFVDLNNDGWEDLIVANGFITTDDTGDL